MTYKTITEIKNDNDLGNAEVGDYFVGNRGAGNTGGLTFAPTLDMDTSPTLAGNLDLDGHNIVNGATTITPTELALLDGVTGKTGTGQFVLDTSPTIATATLSSPTMTTPILGTPTSGNLVNCTGYPISVTTVTGTLPATNGGTGQSSYSQGDLIYASGSTSIVKLAKNTNATRYLSNTGTDNNPAWAQVNLANGVTGTLPNTNLNIATQSDQETGTSTTVLVTPGFQKFHPSAAKSWVFYTSNPSTVILTSYRVTSLTDNGTGDTTVNLTDNYGASNNYAMVASVNDNAAQMCIRSTATATTARLLTFTTTTGALVDSTPMAVFYGDLA